MNSEKVRGKRCSVIGGARSGISVARLLRDEGGIVFLSDQSPAEKMEQAARDLEGLGVQWEFGGHTDRVFEADLMVVSPGVPSDAWVLVQANSRGIPVVSEVEAASWFCPAPIIAVTGTNGKTTTTALIGRMFSDARRQHEVGGNIGVAFSQIVHRLNSEGAAILEISSFQLDHVSSFKPRVSLLLNITPDHLDRYAGSFENYVASKCRIFAGQGAGDAIVYNEDDPVVRNAVSQSAPAGPKRLAFSSTSPVATGAYVDGVNVVLTDEGQSSTLARTDEISIRGIHNLQNAMAASLAAREMGIPLASIRATLKNFKGVEHRLEFVREVNGVSYINDSKATNVDSVWYALQSFESQIILLLGGRDKGNDYSRLTSLVQRHVKSIVAIGESAEKVSRAFAGVVPVIIASTMEQAVERASTLASTGDVVLLSPACASFDWFTNYEERGRVFKQYVAGL